MVDNDDVTKCGCGWRHKGWWRFPKKGLPSQVDWYDYDQAIRIKNGVNKYLGVTDKTQKNNHDNRFCMGLFLTALKQGEFNSLYYDKCVKNLKDRPKHNPTKEAMTDFIKFVLDPAN